VDKKSLIGLGLIAAILGVWLYVSGPSKEQIARNKVIKDSIDLAQRKLEVIESAKIAASQNQTATVDSIKQSPVISDSAKAVELQSNFRDFTPAVSGKAEVLTLENENIKASISTLN
jgi:YidC/Oxa1 family membrane protein insertase